MVVPAPKQCNTEAEKAAIKEGRVPEEWELVDLPIPMFGYKNHIGIARATIKIDKANPATSAGQRVNRNRLTSQIHF